MSTVVVNLRKEPYDIYIGRPGMFGNVHKVAPFHCVYCCGMVHSREEAIAAYRQYFLDRVAADEFFRQEVLKLKGLRLGCYCKPLPCHGDVIVEWLEGGQ